MTKADSWVKFQNSNQCAWKIMNPVMKMENSGALNKPVGQAQQIFHLNQSSRHKDMLHLGNYEEKNKPIIFFPKIKPRTSHLPTLTPCHLSNASKGTNPTNFSISRKVEETCHGKTNEWSLWRKTSKTFHGSKLILVIQVLFLHCLPAKFNFE